MKKVLGIILLTNCLVLIPGLQADDHHDHDRRIAERRHEWNEREDRAYRQYLKERHRNYRDWARLNHKEQNEYWKWRDHHSEWDHR